MEIISKISKGSKMDQIYISKNRIGFNIGEYVVITPLQNKKEIEKPYFYDIDLIEPVKLEIVNNIFEIIHKKIKYENIIITGSFLEKGFNFDDIDTLIVTEDKINEKIVEKDIENSVKIKNHIILFNRESFRKALEIDPIWRLMISKCISKNRLVPMPSIKIDYRYLDAQMLKSNLLLNNFHSLTGKEKYKLTRNLIAIDLFVKKIHLSKNKINNEIERRFNVKIEDLKNNTVDNNFFRKYKTFYKKFENELIENATQNRKKLIDLFIGNLSNVVVHQISLEATDNLEIASKYEKELETSLEIARKYRKKINPRNSNLFEKDLQYIKTKVKNKAISELKKRILKGYKNIDLNLVEVYIERILKEINK